MTGTAIEVENSGQQQDPLDREYYYRDGMEMRPAPEHATVPSLRYMRDLLYRDWLDVGDGWQNTAQTRLLDDHRWQGDEVMDGVVAMFDRIGAARGRELFEQAIAGDSPTLREQLPEELRRLCEQIYRLPDWYDPVRIERGRRLLIDVSVPGKLAASAFGMFATATSQDVSGATGATGHIVREPIRRAVESQAFFEAITYSGGLMAGADTFSVIVRVRLMHSLVRRGLRRQWGDDNFRAHGMPISNTRLAEGSGWFASMPMLADHMLGRRRPMRDHDDVALYWAYILYLFGVEERLIPLNGYDSITLANHIFCDAGEASPWRIELIEGLLRPLREQVPVGGMQTVKLPLGAAAAVMGIDTISKALTGTDYESVNLKQCRRLFLAFARPLVTATAVGDRIPALRNRKWRRASPGDTLQMVAGRGLRRYGRKHGVTEISFMQHDKNTSGKSFESHSRASSRPAENAGRLRTGR
ncbi:oxygenase MpaB family protein [Mycolicibacter minnesotensis]